MLCFLWQFDASWYSTAAKIKEDGLCTTSKETRQRLAASFQRKTPVFKCLINFIWMPAPYILSCRWNVVVGPHRRYRNDWTLKSTQSFPRTCATLFKQEGPVKVFFSPLFFVLCWALALFFFAITPAGNVCNIGNLVGSGFGCRIGVTCEGDRRDTRGCVQAAATTHTT